MKILLVNRHFAQEHVPTGRMLADLAKTLCKNGHQVSVITAKSSYVETVQTLLHHSLITVRYLFTFGEKYRLISWLVFLVQAWYKILFTKYDRVLLLTDPPFLAAICIVLSMLKRKSRNVFWWMMDLYPEMLNSSGMIQKSSPIYKLLHNINEQIITRMGGFILLGHCQHEIVGRYKKWKDINFVVVPPWDFRRILPVKQSENRFIKKYNLENKKIALYAGNLGEGHIYHPLVALAKLLEKRKRTDWTIVFVIRGSRKASLKAALGQTANVHLLDYQPEELTADLLFSAHIHLITMHKDAKGLVVPSKLYGALSTNAPVVFVGPQGADTAREIIRYQAGLCFDENESSERILDAIDDLYEKTKNGEFTKLPIDNNGPQIMTDFICG